jgi:hypothetical protein
MVQHQPAFRAQLDSLRPSIFSWVERWEKLWARNVGPEGFTVSLVPRPIYSDILVVDEASRASAKVSRMEAKDDEADI